MAKRGPKPRYLWDKWFAKKQIMLRKGEHYDTSAASFAQQVRNAASHRNIPISLTEGPDYFIVTRTDHKQTTNSAKQSVGA